MEKKAFEQIISSLKMVLEKQDFVLDENSRREDETGCRAFFVGKDLAYGVFYEAERKRIMLRYCSVENGIPAEKWHNRSTLLYDPENEDDARTLTASVIADFTDEVAEKDNRAAVLQQVKKNRRHKDSESKTDALFFFNRLVNVFPELREETAAERIKYGKLRTATFSEQTILPKIQKLLSEKEPPQSKVKKLGEIFSELYENGDFDVRSVITFVFLNNLSAEAVEKLKPYFSKDMEQGCTAARNMRGKNLKPEKPKKQHHISLESLDGAHH